MNSPSGWQPQNIICIEVPPLALAQGTSAHLLPHQVPQRALHRPPRVAVPVVRLGAGPLPALPHRRAEDGASRGHHSDLPLPEVPGLAPEGVPLGSRELIREEEENRRRL